MRFWEFLTSPTAPWWVPLAAAFGGYLVNSVASRRREKRQAISAATADRIDRARLLSLDGLSQCLAVIGLLDAAIVTRNSMPRFASEKYNESLKAHRREINTAIFGISNTATQLRILGYDQIAEFLNNISDDLQDVEWVDRRMLKRNQARTEQIGRDVRTLRNVITTTFRSEVLAPRVKPQKPVVPARRPQEP